MPLTFKDTLAQDLEGAFFNTNEFAESVTIARGVLQTVGVAAIVAVREYERKDPKGGVGTAVRSVDFDIITSKYQISAVAVDPVDGDKLINSGGEEFEAMPMDGKTCFHHTESGMVLRVHTKRIVRA